MIQSSPERRVLFVTDSLAVGGRERQMTLLAANLSGDWARMVWSMHPGSHAGTLRRAGIPLLIREPGQNPLGSLRKLIRTFKPDVVHYWGTSIFLATYPMVRAMGIPAVNGSIRIGVLPPNPLNRIRILLASRLCPYVVANSQAGLRAARVPVRNGYVVGNGIDLSLFPTVLESSSGEPFKVVMCANVLGSKKHELLAETAELAWRKLGSEAVQFLNIGAERDLGILSRVRAAAVNALRESVLILGGSMRNPVEEIRRANMGIHLSNREGLSNSVMEEMACWLPVLASDVGGMGELIVPGTGFLERSNRPDVILEEVLRLKDDPQLRREVGARARARIEDCFSVNRMCESTEAVYLKAMSGER